MFRSLRRMLVLAGLGMVARKVLASRSGAPAPTVSAMDRKMDRKGMPGAVRP